MSVRELLFNPKPNSPSKHHTCNCMIDNKENVQRDLGAKWVKHILVHTYVLVGKTNLHYDPVPLSFPQEHQSSHLFQVLFLQQTNEGS